MLVTAALAARAVNSRTVRADDEQESEREQENEKERGRYLDGWIDRGATRAEIPALPRQHLLRRPKTGLEQ